jgi:hypothetical protein
MMNPFNQTTSATPKISYAANLYINVTAASGAGRLMAGRRREAIISRVIFKIQL